MIVTPRIVARIAVVSLLAVLLQLSFFSRVELFHVSPDVLPAYVACMGLLGGTMAGAVSGFAIGGMPGTRPRPLRRTLRPWRWGLPRRRMRSFLARQDGSAPNSKPQPTGRPLAP